MDCFIFMVMWLKLAYSKIQQMMKNVIMVEPSSRCPWHQNALFRKMNFLELKIEESWTVAMEALSFDKHSTINLRFHDGHHIGDGWTWGKNTNASCINIVLDIGQFKLLRYDVRVRQGQTIYNVLNTIYPVLCCFKNDTFMFITFALWSDTLLPSACRICNIRNTFYIDSKISNRQMSKVMLNGA